MASDNSTRLTAEKAFSCCGFNNYTDGYMCREQVPECAGGPANGTYISCPFCKTAIGISIEKAFSAAGGVGLFFAFTEVRKARFTFEFPTIFPFKSRNHYTLC